MFRLSELYPGQNLGTHFGPKVSFSLLSSYSFMAVYYQKMRQHLLQKGSMSKLLQGSPSSKSQNQIKKIKLFLFDLAPAASDFSEEIEAELLNDLVSNGNIMCAKFWLRLEILLEYLWLSLVIRDTTQNTAAEGSSGS